MMNNKGQWCQNGGNWYSKFSVDLDLLIIDHCKVAINSHNFTTQIFFCFCEPILNWNVEEKNSKNLYKDSFKSKANKI